jgi:hypothetical protein
MSSSRPITSSWRRRIARGLEGLFGPAAPVDDAPARALLSPEALNRFRAMSIPDQAHSLRVYAWLTARGHREEDLLIAALLHDCGKAAARLAVWQRTLKVLLKKLAPGWWLKLSGPAPEGSWRYPFFILREHPRIGAAWAREAGCSELTCWLIEQHEEDLPASHPHLDLLIALQEADAAS